MKSEQKWVLKYFHEVAQTVPAYKKFLKAKGVNHSKIKTMEDFANVPIINKENYLKVYPFLELFPNKKIPSLVSMSSGSSGKSFFWPQNEGQEKEGAFIHEKIFKDIFKIGNKSTLVIVSFSMGTWVAGTYTMNCAKLISKKGYNLSTIAPGVGKETSIEILQNFAGYFDNVILAGYPPFVMDIIDELNQKNIDISKLNLKLLFAGESFSENWRDIIHNMSGIKDEFFGSVGIYGTADAAILGHETPLTIFLRRKMSENKELLTKLMGDYATVPPTFQYYPQYKYFQKFEDKMVFTAKSGIPLVRYDIKDNGELMSYDEMLNILNEFGYSKEIKKNKLAKNWEMPFVFLRNRRDVSIIFYALNIYPENIKVSLESNELSKYFTGKFVTSVDVLNQGREQQLIIKLELRNGVESSEELKNRTTSIVTENLKKLNSEYRKLYASIADKATPRIDLIPFGDDIFVVKKSKHQWVKR